MNDTLIQIFGTLGILGSIYGDVLLISIISFIISALVSQKYNSIVYFFSVTICGLLRSALLWWLLVIIKGNNVNVLQWFADSQILLLIFGAWVFIIFCCKNDDKRWSIILAFYFIIVGIPLEIYTIISLFIYKFRYDIIAFVAVFGIIVLLLTICVFCECCCAISCRDTTNYVIKKKSGCAHQVIGGEIQQC